MKVKRNHGPVLSFNLIEFENPIPPYKEDRAYLIVSPTENWGDQSNWAFSWGQNIAMLFSAIIDSVPESKQVEFEEKLMGCFKEAMERREESFAETVKMNIEEY